MSDFWSTKLGQQQAPPQQPAPASQRPWWDTSSPVTPQAQQQAQILYDAQGNAFVMGPNGQLMQVQPPQQQEYTTAKAASARSTALCPACNSKNYAIIGKGMNIKTAAFDAYRCYDCGYPVQQEFTGMGSVSDAPVAGRARQISHDGGGLAGNYQPQNTAAGRVT